MRNLIDFLSFIAAISGASWTVARWIEGLKPDYQPDRPFDWQRDDPDLSR